MGRTGTKARGANRKRADESAAAPVETGCEPVDDCCCDEGGGEVDDVFVDAAEAANSFVDERGETLDEGVVGFVDEGAGSATIDVTPTNAAGGFCVAGAALTELRVAGIATLGAGLETGAGATEEVAGTVGTVARELEFADWASDCLESCVGRKSTPQLNVQSVNRPARHALAG